MNRYVEPSHKCYISASFIIYILQGLELVFEALLAFTENWVGRNFQIQMEGTQLPSLDPPLETDDTYNFF